MVEWAVKMVRLPAEATLRACIERGDLRAEILAGLARRLAVSKGWGADGVEGVHWYELAGMGSEVVIYPNNSGYVAII